MLFVHPCHTLFYYFYKALEENPKPYISPLISLLKNIFKLYYYIYNTYNKYYNIKIKYFIFIIYF